jgi:hypothetical protein
MVDRPEPARARDVGYEILDALSASFELSEWFPKSLVDRITQPLAASAGLETGDPARLAAEPTMGLCRGRVANPSSGRSADAGDHARRSSPHGDHHG